MKGTIKIRSKLTDKQVVENCLAYYHAGYEYIFLLVFHAFAKGWKIDELLYYKDLIETS